MKRALAAALCGLAGLAGTARADTFVVVPASTAPAAPLTVPSADVPNAPGSLLLPPGWTSAASAPRALTVAELQALWTRAGNAYGIPWYVLGAINKVETNFGRNMGPSSAGAVGWMQFMPDTWLRWGLDANGDGLADPWNAEDAVFAAARYLAAAGGRTDLYRAVFAYNHADWYVREVLDLASFYARAGADETFELDRLEVDLEEARRTVAETAERLTEAVRSSKRLARQARSLEGRADSATLLSSSIPLRQRAVQIGLRGEEAAARAETLRAELEEARHGLELARQRAAGASFSAGAATVLGAPAYAGGFVFPVGGGPAVVSVSHHHHDYPAADIAAPEGAPLYALADGVVSATHDDGRCGIGLTLQTMDSRRWTYCHLSYREPGVQPGALLGAGAPVGLVGSTGHSTGPHLHLQLQPAASYPQEEAWFQGFAGAAFTWQDEAPGRALAVADAHPVFAVVPSGEAGSQHGGPVVPDGVVAFTVTR
jgi:murein DD-endopeptidase MepM/ murein hydrolase activator NlpD